jgi:hypothetical protein
VWQAREEAARQQWQEEAQGILYEQGGEALLVHLQALTLPPRTSAVVHEELRKLRGYFENNRHRTDYPTYRRNGWDIGSGPTEAGCKIIGERLKGSGMPLGRGWSGDRGGAAGTLRQQWQTLGWLLGPAASAAAAGSLKVTQVKDSHPR